MENKKGTKTGDLNMRKLLKMLKEWNLKHDAKFDKWQRNVLFEFITTDYCKEVKKQNG